MTLTSRQTRNFLIREVKKEQLKRREYVKICNLVLKENKFIIENERYFTRQEINENFLSTLTSLGGDLFDNLLPGLLGDMKQKIATGLLRNIGLNPKSAFGRIVINVFEEIKYTEIMGYFSDWKTGCPKLIEVVLRAITDAVIEYLIEKFLGAKDTADQSGIIGTFRETLTTTLDDKLMPAIAPAISKFICKINVPGMIGKIKQVASGEIKPQDLLSNIKSGVKVKPSVTASVGAGDTKQVASALSKI